MKKKIDCPECGLDIIDSLTLKELKDLNIDINKELEPFYNFKIIIPETVEEELKHAAIKKLYKNLTLEQLDNLVKQFVKII